MLRNFTTILSIRTASSQFIRPTDHCVIPIILRRNYFELTMPPRRSARGAAAAPKYDETSDNDAEFKNGVEEAIAKPSPKKRAPRTAAKAAVDTKENMKAKASPKKKVDITEVDAEVEVSKKGKAAVNKVVNDVAAKVEEKVKEEMEETTTAKVKVRVGKGKGTNGEAITVKPQEVEVVKKGKASAKRKVKTDDGEAEENTEEKVEKKVIKKRKTKEEKEAELLPLAQRTDVATLPKKMYIGAHISGAGGVQNSITNALHIGANAFAVFLKSQRKWASPPLADEAKDGFLKNCIEQKYDQGAHVLPHGSYLVNLAQEEEAKAQQAYECFLDDLKRCDALGIKLFNFHPGNTGPHPRPEAIARIAAQLNKAHKATTSVITVLENMAGQGNVIGSAWEDLRDIIALVEDKSRVGVCIDTCHAFAAGYDLRSAEAFAKTMQSFNDIVGAQYLKALHLNDSKTPLGSNRDLHYNIGSGFLGLRAFYNVVNYAGFEGLPMVLETPIDKKGEDGKVVEDKSVWATEIKLLERMIGVDFETKEWRDEEERLWEQGKSEREKFEKQVEKKKQKSIADMFKKEAKGRGKGKAKKEEEVETESEGEEGGCSHA